MITKSFKELIASASKDTKGFPRLAKILENERKAKEKQKRYTRIAQEVCREMTALETAASELNSYPMQIRAALDLYFEAKAELENDFDWWGEIKNG